MSATWIATLYRESTYQNLVGFGGKWGDLRYFTAAFHAAITRCAYCLVGNLTLLPLPVGEGLPRPVYYVGGFGFSLGGIHCRDPGESNQPSEPGPGGERRGSG